MKMIINNPKRQLIKIALRYGKSAYSMCIGKAPHFSESGGD
jgi:hypothetical protein